MKNKEYRTRFTEEEIKEKSVDLSFYKPNSVSFKLMLLTICCEIIYLIITLNSIAKDINILIVSLFNIGLLMILFLTALKLKVYSHPFTIVASIFTAYLIFRLCYIIPFFLNISPIVDSNTSQEVIDSVINRDRNWMYGLNCVGFVSSLAATVISWIKVKRQIAYKKAGKISKVELSK